MYIIKLMKHKNDRPHGIVNNIVGIIISILLSFSLQLFNVIISWSLVIFNTYIYYSLNGILSYFLIKGWLILLSSEFIRCEFLEIITFNFISISSTGCLIYYSYFIIFLSQIDLIFIPIIWENLCPLQVK